MQSLFLVNKFFYKSSLFLFLSLHLVDEFLIIASRAGNYGSKNMALEEKIWSEVSWFKQWSRKWSRGNTLFKYFILFKDFYKFSVKCRNDETVFHIIKFTNVIFWTITILKRGRFSEISKQNKQNVTWE